MVSKSPNFSLIGRCGRFCTLSWHFRNGFTSYDQIGSYVPFLFRKWRNHWTLIIIIIVTNFLQTNRILRLWQTWAGWILAYSNVIFVEFTLFKSVLSYKINWLLPYGLCQKNRWGYYSHNGKFLKVVSIPKVNVTILEEFKKLS